MAEEFYEGWSPVTRCKRMERVSESSESGVTLERGRGVKAESERRTVREKLYE